MSYQKLTPIIAEGATEPRYLEDRFADVVNVKDFGAKGDGVNDDTSSINAAITAASNGKHILLMPHGVYKISSPILVKSDVHIHGCGSKIINEESLWVDDRYWAIEAKGSQNNRLHDFYIEELFLDDVQGGILVWYADNFELSHIRIKTNNAWNICTADTNNFYIHDINFVNDRGPFPTGIQTDGIHIIGPARTGFIKNINGCNGDDMFCLQTRKQSIQINNGLVYPSSYGDIEDILIDGVKTSTFGADVSPDGGYFNTTHSLFAFNCYKEERLDHILIKNVCGSYRGTSIVNFSGKYITDEYSSNIGDIKFQNFDIWRDVNSLSSASGYFPFMIESPHIESLTFENIRLRCRYLPASAIFRIAPDSNPSSTIFDETPIQLDRLVIKDFIFECEDADSSTDVNLTSAFMRMTEDVTADFIDISNVTIKAKKLKFVINIGGATVNRINIDKCDINIDNRGLISNNSLQPCSFINVAEDSVVGIVNVNNVYCNILSAKQDNSYGENRSFNINSNIDVLNIKNSTIVSPDEHAIGVYISGHKIKAFSVNDCTFEKTAFPVLSNQSKFDFVSFKDLNLHSCGNSLYFIGTSGQTIGILELKDCVSTQSSYSLSFNDTVSVSRFLTNVPMLGAPMPTSPKEGDSFCIGHSRYVIAGGVLRKFDISVVE